MCEEVEWINLPVDGVQRRVLVTMVIIVLRLKKDDILVFLDQLSGRWILKNSVFHKHNIPLF